MTRPRAAAATLLALAALTLTACGEKNDNLAGPPADEQTVPVVPPGATTVRVDDAAAKALARSAATEAAAATVAVDPAVWKVTCADAPKQYVNCQVRSPICKGPVVLKPAKVPAGKSAEDYSPIPDATGVRCAKPVAKKSRPPA